MIKKVNASLRLGLKVALRRFLWLAAVILVWVLAVRLDLLDRGLIGNVNLILSVILFVLTIPVGLFIRIDQLMLENTYALNEETKLLLMLPVVLINFLLFGAYRGWRFSLLTPEQLEARRNKSWFKFGKRSPKLKDKR